MSVSSLISSISYAGNASTSTQYPIPFNFSLGSDIEVLVTDLYSNVTILSLTTGFLVVGGAGGTGNLTTVAAIPATSSVTVARLVPATQLFSFTTGDRFPSTTVEQAFDKLTFLLQQVIRSLGKSVRAADSSADLAPLTSNPSSGSWVLQLVNGVLNWSAPATVSMADGSVTPSKITSSSAVAWTFNGGVNGTFTGSLTGTASSVSGSLTGTALGQAISLALIFG